jgi:hypothetical protein
LFEMKLSRNFDICVRFTRSFCNKEPISEDISSDALFFLPPGIEKISLFLLLEILEGAESISEAKNAAQNSSSYSPLKITRKPSSLQANPLSNKMTSPIKTSSHYQRA